MVERARWRVHLEPEVERALRRLPRAEQAEVRRAVEALPDGEVTRVPSGAREWWLWATENWGARYVRDDPRRRITVTQLRRTTEAPFREVMPTPIERHLWLIIFPGLAMLGILLVAGVVALLARRPPAPAGTVSFREPARQHVTASVAYDHTPPAGGPHNPRWLTCGIYDHPVKSENAVHSLEHGAVWLTYRPDLGAADLQRLRDVVKSSSYGDPHVILSPFAGLPSPVVASAWGSQLVLHSTADQRLDQFIAHFMMSPDAPEPKGYCGVNGVGTPLR